MMRITERAAGASHTYPLLRDWARIHSHSLRVRIGSRAGTRLRLARYTHISRQTMY
jgi:hypothetical protein